MPEKKNSEPTQAALVYLGDSKVSAYVGNSKDSPNLRRQSKFSKAADIVDGVQDEVFDGLDNGQTASTRYPVMAMQMREGGVSLGAVLDNLGPQAKETAAHSPWLGILLFLPSLLLGLFLAKNRYKSEEANRQNNDPVHLASLLSDELMKDLSTDEVIKKNEIASRIQDLNKYLEKLQREPYYQTRYKKLQFEKDEKGELTWVFEANPTYQPPVAEKPSKLSLAYDTAKYGIMWFGFWYWILMISSATLTGNFNWIFGLSPLETGFVVAGLLVPFALGVASKLYKHWEEAQAPPTLLTVEQQEDLMNILRRSRHKIQFDNANRHLNKQINTQEKELLKLNNQMLDSKEIKPEGKIDNYHTQYLDWLKQYPKLKLAIAMAAAGTLHFAIYQYNFVAVSLLSDPNGKVLNSDVNPELMNLLAAILVEIAVAHAVHEYLKRKKDLTELADQVNEIKTKKSEILDHMDQQRNHLKALETQEAKLAHNSSATQRGQVASLPSYKTEADSLWELLKQNKWMTVWIAFMAAVSGIFLTRALFIPGTALLPGVADKAFSLPLMGSISFWQACAMALVLGAPFWVGVKTYRYLANQKEAQTKSFMSQLEERREILDWQVEHAQKRIAFVGLQNEVNKEKRNQVMGLSAQSKSNSPSSKFLNNESSDDAYDSDSTDPLIASRSRREQAGSSCISHSPAIPGEAERPQVSKKSGGLAFSRGYEMT